METGEGDIKKVDQSDPVSKQPQTGNGEEIVEKDDGIVVETPDNEYVYSDDFESTEGEESDVEDNLGSSSNLTRSRDSNPALPETVTVLETSWGSKVYVVGTAHFSQESQEDVSKTIVATQPDVVMVELCNGRINILQYDEETLLKEAKEIDFSKVKHLVQQSGVIQGMMHVFFLSMSAHLTKQLGMAPGGEFRRAFTEAKKITNCRLQLGDRPIQITLSRALSSLSTWQTLKLAFHLITSKDSITKEDVEKCKQKDLLEEMLMEMTGEFPGLSKVFVDERDTFLAHSLKHAAQLQPHPTVPGAFVPSVVVGVVGMGHVPGIKANWDRLQYDIREIMQMPEQKPATRLLKFGLRVSLFGLAVCLIAGATYGGYKLFGVTMNKVAEHAASQR